MADTVKIDRVLNNKKLKDLLADRMKLGTNGNKDKEKLNAALEKIVVEVVENAKFLVPVELAVEPVKDKDGGLCVPTSANVTFVIFSLDEKQRFIPIFSDTETYNKWEDKAANVHAMTMDFPSLANLLEKSALDEGLVLNPFTDNMMIKHDMALKWFEQFQIARNGTASHAIPASMADKTYNLNPYPFQLSNVLCEAARGTPSINAMWLRGINLNNDESYLLIVDFTGDRQQAISPLGEAARKFLGDKPLHIVPLDEGFGGRAAKGAAPIYTKD